MLPCLLLALGLGAAPAHAGTTYAFTGGKVLKCSNKAKVYTCDSIALPEWDDKMVIGDGYTVNVNSDITFGYNHGLAMSGSARLTSTGNIDLTGLNPPNLAVTGGSFEAGKAFSVAGPNQMKADVTAGSLSLGTGPTFQITGTMVSRGAVAINSGATVIGSVSGTAITTESPFRVTGNVTASDTLLVASNGTIEGTVVGNTSITINSPATLSKSVTSQGPVTIGSGVTIGGVVKGSTITADSPVTLNSDVVASTRFTLGSGSTVTGNITAPEVELYAASSSVTGNVTASKLLTLGSSVKIRGTVDTGQLTLYASDAIIEGTAKVDFATLFWNGRVTQNIVCKSGTRAGYCDCVDNQSGNPVNSANGPRCESGKPNPGTLHHFQITHDGSAQACAAESVTVTACANAACTAPHYSGGAAVTLQPGGAATAIGSSGVATGSVTRNTAGTEALKLAYSGATVSGATCRNSASGSASCDMAFSGGVSFSIEAAPFRAGESGSARLKAVESDPKTGQCVAAFRNTSKALAYSCDYATTSKGLLGLALADATLGGNASLVCSTRARQSVNTRFDADGAARLTLGYQDVGKVKLMAELDDAKGDTTFVVAPHRFGFSALPTAPLKEALRAGDPFEVTVNALNARGDITPSFDKAALPAEATSTTLAVACVQKGDAGVLGAAVTEFGAGSAKPRPWWSEAGQFDLGAKLSSFLGSGLNVEGGTNEIKDGCSGKLGPFLPKYFLVDQAEEELKKRSFYYAGEPVPVRITAMNARNAVTRNYAGALGYSAALTLSAYDAARANKNPNGGVLGANDVPAAAFVDGVALASPVYGPAVAAPLAPTTVLLRAATAAPVVTSDDTQGTYEKAQPLIRSGRLRVGSNAGRVNQPLILEVATDYWSGSSWLLNDKDSITRIRKDAFAQSAVGRPKTSQAPTVVKLAQDVVIDKGKGKVTLSGDRPGWIDLAVNLGAGTQDIACLDTHPDSTGARLAWLRLPVGCRDPIGRDPVGRATFGELPPENRRIIHVREVFN